MFTFSSISSPSLSAYPFASVCTTCWSASVSTTDSPALNSSAPWPTSAPATCDSSSISSNLLDCASAAVFGRARGFRSALPSRRRSARASCWSRDFDTHAAAESISSPASCSPSERPAIFCVRSRCRRAASSFARIASCSSPFACAAASSAPRRAALGVALRVATRRRAASGLRPSSARTRLVSSTVAEISPLASEVCMAARSAARTVAAVAAATCGGTP